MKRPALSCVVMICVMLLAACNAFFSDAASASAADGNTSALRLHACTKTNAQGMYLIKSIYPNAANIVYIDYASRQELFLCGRPECKHIDETCKSYIPLAKDEAPPALYLTDNFLLLVQSAGSESHFPNIQIMQLDGSDKRTLIELGANQFLSNQFFFDENFLYFDTYTQHKEPLMQTHELNRVAFDSGALSVLYTFSEQDCLLIGAMEDGLIVDNVYERNGETIRDIYVWNPAESLDAAIQKGPVCRYSLNEQRAFLSQNKHYALNLSTKAVTQQDLKTGEIITVDCREYIPDFTENLAPNIIQAFDDYIILVTYSENENRSLNVSHSIIDFEQQKVIPLSLTNPYTNQPLTIVSYNETEVCVITNYITQTGTFEHDNKLHVFEYLTEEYALLSKEDYINSTPNYHVILPIDANL